MTEDRITDDQDVSFKLRQTARGLTSLRGAQRFDVPSLLVYPIASLLTRAAKGIEENIITEHYEESPGTYLACERCDHVFGEPRASLAEDRCHCYDDALALLNALTGTRYPCQLITHE